MFMVACICLSVCKTARNLCIKEFVKDLSVHSQAILEVLGLGGGMPSPSALV